MMPFLLLFIELGMMPSGSSYALYDRVNQTRHAEWIDDQVYVAFGVDVDWWGFFLGGNLRTNMWPSVNLDDARPNALASTIRAGWRNNWLEIGARHECIHPVIPYLPAIPVRLSWEGSITEVYLRATVKLGGGE